MQVERRPVDRPATAADGLYGSYQWDMRRVGAPAVWARLPLAATLPRVAVLELDHERLNTLTLTADAWAVGRPLDQQALEAVGVRVASLRRRNGKAETVNDDLMLADGDTLVLSGKPGALAIAVEQLQKG